MSTALAAAVSVVPPGAWAIGVSGGADSIALLTLMANRRPDCRLTLVHVDHHLRGKESDEDATFVRQLAGQLDRPVVVIRRDAVEATAARLPANPSARYRAARLIAFADTVKHHQLEGVLLAHHADDVAETVMLRLLRGGNLLNLGGVRADITVARVSNPCFHRTSHGSETGATNGRRQTALRIVRPLLAICRTDLQTWLTSIGQSWREDSSNASTAYRRNVVRCVLDANPHLAPLLRSLADASDRLREAASTAAPPLDRTFAVRELRITPILARTAAMNWLIARGVPADRATTDVCDRLIAQATDVTQSPRQHYPGRVLVRRRAGRVDVIPNAAVQSPPRPWPRNRQPRRTLNKPSANWRRSSPKWNAARRR